MREREHRWFVWSCSKRCWWGPDSCGYTDDAREAGRYTDAEALSIVARMNYAPTTGAAGRDGLGDPVQLVPVNTRWLTQPSHVMRTAEQWARELRHMVDVVRHDPPHIGVLSRGEQCAVALVIGVDALAHDDPEYKSPTPLRPHGYTWLDCVNRIEPELLTACIRVQRELA